MTEAEKVHRHTERLHQLHQEAMLALEAGRTYDVFILRNARSQSLLEVIDQKMAISSEELALLAQETQSFMKSLQASIDSLHVANHQFIQSIPARKAYASSQAIGEISNYLIHHQGES